jgi:hypothetical protein
MNLRLTTEQAETVKRMSDLVREHPNLSFEEIYRNHIGEFEKSLEGRALARACKKVFDQERRGTQPPPDV